MLYKNKYCVELAEEFLINNKNKMLEIKNSDIFNQSIEL